MQCQHLLHQLEVSSGSTLSQVLNVLRFHNVPAIFWPKIIVPCQIFNNAPGTLFHTLHTMIHSKASCAVRIKCCYGPIIWSVVLFINTQTQKQPFLISTTTPRMKSRFAARKWSVLLCLFRMGAGSWGFSKKSLGYVKLCSIWEVAKANIYESL